MVGLVCGRSWMSLLRLLRLVHVLLCFWLFAGGCHRSCQVIELGHIQCACFLFSAHIPERRYIHSSLPFAFYIEIIKSVYHYISCFFSLHFAWLELVMNMMNHKRCCLRKSLFKSNIFIGTRIDEW